MEKVLYKITELSPIDAMYPYRYTFEGAEGYFEDGGVGYFAEGFSAGTFTFVPPIRKVGAIENMKSGTFIGIKVVPA